MIPPEFPPPHGISLPIRWKRVIDGDTIEAKLPSGRLARIRIEGLDCPELPTADAIAAKHALEGLLESTDSLTAFVPLPRDIDKNGILDLDEIFEALSFKRVRTCLFAGSYRIDLWMIEHGHVKA